MNDIIPSYKSVTPSGQVFLPHLVYTTPPDAPGGPIWPSLPWAPGGPGGPRTNNNKNLFI